MLTRGAAGLRVINPLIAAPSGLARTVSIIHLRPVGPGVILASRANNWQITPLGYLTQVPLLFSQAISNFVKWIIHLLLTKPGWGIAGHCQDLQEQSAAAPPNGTDYVGKQSKNKANRRVVDTNLSVHQENGSGWEDGGGGGRHKNKQTNAIFLGSKPAQTSLLKLTHELIEVVYWDPNCSLHSLGEQASKWDCACSSKERGICPVYRTAKV